MSKGRIKKQFPGQTGLYQGKVRVVRTVGSVLVVETTDNISAFDIVLPVEIPKKGVILAIISRYFMKATEDIIPNCLIDAPGLHPRMALWRKTTPFKFEVVVRAYMEGSMWREQYSIGQRDLWGYHLPEGIKYQQKLPYLMFTPSTKAPDGEHDEPISRDQILERGLATAEEYDYIYAKAFELFKRGEEMATTQGLILVDTKYEFGKDENGKIYLIDEVHTPDSSRYYYLEGYDKKFQREEPQKQLSKEFVRQWLLDQGYSGKKDQKMPDLNKGFIETVQRRYEELYDAIVEPRPRIYFKAYNDVPDSDGDVLYEQVSAALVKIRPQIEGPTVGVIMGSNSDLPMMEKGLEILTLAGVPFECGAVSAHRTPMDIEQYAATARERGIKVIIAAAGGAAHLPGMVAASTTLPVIGVPIKSANSIMGVDSLLSIVQMPAGVPVGTMATDGAENAGLYALQILATHDERIAAYLVKHKENLITKVSQMRKDTASKYFFGL